MFDNYFLDFLITMDTTAANDVKNGVTEVRKGVKEVKSNLIQLEKLLVILYNEQKLQTQDYLDLDDIEKATKGMSNVSLLKEKHNELKDIIECLNIEEKFCMKGDVVEGKEEIEIEYIDTTPEEEEDSVMDNIILKCIENGILFGKDTISILDKYGHERTTMIDISTGRVYDKANLRIPLNMWVRTSLTKPLKLSDILRTANVLRDGDYIKIYELIDKYNNKISGI